MYNNYIISLMEGAAATYFKSLHDSSRRAKSGKLEGHGTLCRRQGRRRDVSLLLLLLSNSGSQNTNITQYLYYSHSPFCMLDLSHWQLRIFWEELLDNLSPIKNFSV